MPVTLRCISLALPLSNLTRGVQTLMTITNNTKIKIRGALSAGPVVVKPTTSVLGVESFRNLPAGSGWPLELAQSVIFLFALFIAPETRLLGVARVDVPSVRRYV